MRNYYIKNGTLIEYKGNADHAVIPKGVTVIGNNAFEGCRNLTSINIPDSVTWIGDYAFRNCYNLASIKIPNRVTHIGDYVFRDCSSLLSAVISNNVKRIEWGTFKGCKSIKNINIPSSVKRIEGEAFSGCTNLTNINIPNSVTYIRFCAFDDINKVKPQYNENGALRAFKGFNKDWVCRNFQYEVGKSFHQDGNIECCENGFHACTNPLDVFNYYNGQLDELRFAEVELSGELNFDIDNSKVAASDIKIVRELSASELAEIYSNMEKC